MLKNMFGRKQKQSESSDRELTIEDLVTLERYEEAAEKLKKRISMVPKDLHAHLKLAEVYVGLKNVTKALDEYVFVADSHADDGFFDKAIAILSKAGRLAPGDEYLPKRLDRYRHMKQLENRRKLAVEGLMANKTTLVGSAANSKLEVELLWNKIAKSHLVAELSGENLQKLFSVMDMFRSKRGQILAEAGSQVPVMYLVVDGVVDARALVNGKKISIRSFSTGDVIGDSALLERKSWPAHYVVAEAGTLFRLSREGLEQAMKGNDDPLAFISVLRQQQNDRDVAASVMRIS